MDWTFWVGLVVIIAILGVSRWAFTLRQRRDKIRGENREVAGAVQEAQKAKRQGGDPLGGGGFGPAQ